MRSSRCVRAINVQEIDPPRHHIRASSLNDHRGDEEVGGFHFENLFMNALTDGSFSDLDWMQTGYIGEIPMTFKLDSGSQVDIKKTTLVVQKSNVMLKSYSRNQMRPIGQTWACVTFGKATCTVELQGVQGEVKQI